jgi:hypothetical protein
MISKQGTVAQEIEKQELFMWFMDLMASPILISLGPLAAGTAIAHMRALSTATKLALDPTSGARKFERSSSTE